MATITGLTAARMLSIEGQSVISGAIVGGHLILTKYDGTTVDAGALPPGPTGAPGPPGGMIPGEVRMWSGATLPVTATWGKWVWADGAIYQVSTYPVAAANIDNAWRTFGGASNPPAGQFRVPDLRGLVAAGLDAMPGGTRANRTTRSIAITLAGKTGEEQHVITLAEVAAHTHPVTGTVNVTITDPGHSHDLVNNGDVTGAPYAEIGRSVTAQSGETGRTINKVTGITASGSLSSASASSVGSNNAHENMQPTVFVPYIVKLDG